MKSGSSGAAGDAMELGEQQSRRAPSDHTRVTSVESRLFPNQQLRARPGRLPRVHPSVFKVGSSAISAGGNDNVDLSGEFFCQPTESSSIRPRPGLRPRTDNARYLLTQDRHEPGNFGEGFLPALQEDESVADRAFPLVDFDDISASSVGQPGSGLHRKHPPVGTFRTDDTSWSRTPADDREFPVTWPDVNTTRSRRTVESIRRSQSQEGSISRHRWRQSSGFDGAAEGRSVRRIPPTHGTSRPVARLMTELDFGWDISSSSSSSSLVEQPTIQLHRSSSDHSSPSLFFHHAETSPFNEYFTSAVNLLSHPVFDSLYCT